MKVQKEIEILRRMADLLEENEILHQSQLEASYEPEKKSGYTGIFVTTLIGSAAMFGYVYLQGGL